MTIVNLAVNRKYPQFIRLALHSFSHYIQELVYSSFIYFSTFQILMFSLYHLIFLNLVICTKNLFIRSQLRFCLFLQRGGFMYYFLSKYKLFQERLAWGVIILLGGGFALAEGAKRTCLTVWVGQQLAKLGGLQSQILRLFF